MPVARPEMEDVILAIDSLKKASSEHKNRATETAAEQLNSVVTLLELSSPSNASLSRLCTLFLSKFAALYAACPLQMFQFCAAVLGVIFRQKIEVAFIAQKFAAQSSWEIVQKSVVSSVLDFLEQNPSKANKTAAANGLYSTICDIHYRKSPLFQWRSPNLIFNVNFFLSETATHHPENQTQLRNSKILGAARMGSALSQSKDFFAVDSLLALIGVLMPSRQNASKRSQFVDTVFTPDLFPRSTQIKSLIAASSSTDWDPVATQIINDCLAKSDISFPQPFYIFSLRTPTPISTIVDPLYVDNKGLFANTENDGVFDSFQVPFTYMERIKLTPSASSTLVALQLTVEPLIGAAETDTPDDQKKRCTMSFQLKNTDTERFLESLRARGVGNLISDADRKVSKIAEGVSLDFNSSGRKPATQQEKVAKVEELWKSTGDPGLGEPTSPLVSQAGRDSRTNSDLAEAGSQHDAIYGDDLSDVEETISKAIAPPLRPSRATSPAKEHDVKANTVSTSSRPRVRIVLDSDDEDDAVSQQPRKTLPRKSAMKKMVVESEEEDAAESQSPPSTNAKDQDFEPTQTEPDPVADVPARITRGAAAKKNLTLATAIDEPSKPSGRARAPAAREMAPADAPEPVRPRPRPVKKPAPADTQQSEDEIENTTTLLTDLKPSSKAQETSADDSKAKKRPNGKGDAAKTEITSKSTNMKNGRKRSRTDDDQDGLDEDTSERPTKRLRGTTEAAREPEEDIPPVLAPRRVSAAVFGARSVNPAPAKRRYGGKKGRTSSPVADAVADNDMAVDYDNLPVPPSPPPPSPVPAKTAKVAKQESGLADTRKSRVAAMKGKDGQKTVRKPEPTAKAPPKSTKAAQKTKMQPVATEESEGDADMGSDNEAKPVRRSTRATKSNAAPKPAEPIVDAIIPKPNAKPVKPKKAPWEDMHLKKNDDVATSDEPPAQSDSYEEYYVPLKGSPYSADPPPIPQDDVTMIDLTQDASPKAKTVQPDNITHSLPVDLTHAFPIELKRRSPISIRAIPEVDSNPATVALQAPKADARTPIRPQARSSPVAQSEPAPLLMTKFESEVLSRPIQSVSVLQKAPTPSPARPSKLPTPVKQMTPPKVVRTKKAPTPPARSPPVHQVYSSPSRPTRTAPAQRQITNDSPFPERIHQAVTFAPPQESPSPSVQRYTNAQFIPARRTTNTHVHDRTPDLGRPARAIFGRKNRGPLRHGGDERDHKRSRSPMQGILEILNEIQEVVVEKISQRFDHVRTDVRLGRDNILRGAAANLEVMCTESERHFNKLVDLEEEYAGYHRKIILGIDDMNKNAEVMANALGQIVQHHDRRTLSKKLPTTLFTLSPSVRNPVLSL
ncbi:hypothetical protein C8R44DRAFT_976758 [Mycena epipterygia]|nr:hypothetical protein C8R44DRAFT_976758 [Mycena epipterygia]